MLGDLAPWNKKQLYELIPKLEAGVSVKSLDREFDSFGHGKYILKTSCVFGGTFFAKEKKEILPSEIHRAKINPQKNTIIISRMNTPELVGECGYVDNDYGDLYLPDRLWITRPTVNPKWLTYMLSYGSLSRSIKDAATGTSNSMKNISKASLLSIELSVPSNQEQEAIANALSNADAYIESLEKLIVKKRLIKNGVMSELLTGNRRLPNFSKPWTKMKLGGIGVFSKGSGIKKDESQSGSIPCIRYGEIYTTHDDIIREFKSFISSKVSEQSTKIRTGDILFAGSGETKEEIGKCVAYTLTQEAFAGGDIIILRPTKGISSFFGYYLNSKSIVRQKASRGQGDAVVHISSASLGEIDIFVPEEAEQLAIAEIIMDIDLSVLTLEVKLRKAKLIKQGMMAELLTGRIRLV